jgi:hypothetical protein
MYAWRSAKYECRKGEEGTAVSMRQQTPRHEDVWGSLQHS